SGASRDGDRPSGLYSPRSGAGFESDGAPPLIVLPHGGPTSQVTASWSAQAQFFATRGYAVLYPNYRGSTGYGRAYMLKLREQWGVLDLEDSRDGAEAMAAQGLAD